MHRIFLLYFLIATSLSAEIDKNGSEIRHRYFWRDFRGIIPKDAFNVTKNLYIGQVLWDNVLIGGYYAGTSAVITEYGGRRTIVRRTIKVKKIKLVYLNIKNMLL